MLDGVLWSVVIPVKRLLLAKTRLSAALGHSASDTLLDPAQSMNNRSRVHRQLPANGRIALAMARDTVRAVLASTAVSTVVVVTDDPLAAEELTTLGARVIADGPDDGLNAALRYGAEWARAQRPADGVSAVSADLATLRSEELTAALDAAANFPRAFVADIHGTGTTLLSALPGTALLPQFGLNSARTHGHSGAEGLDGDWPTLRQDVDTPTDLAVAAALGFGPDTAAELLLLAPDLADCAT